MADNVIINTPSAYQYPLLIRQILETGLTRAPEQVIVYGDLERQTYRQLHERVGRLVSGLAGLGIKVGDTVVVSGLGQPPVLGVLFRDTDDGRHPPNDKCASVTRADPLYHQSCQG